MAYCNMPVFYFVIITPGKKLYSSFFFFFFFFSCYKKHYFKVGGGSEEHLPICINLSRSFSSLWQEHPQPLPLIFIGAKMKPNRYQGLTKSTPQHRYQPHMGTSSPHSSWCWPENEKYSFINKGTVVTKRIRKMKILQDIYYQKKVPFSFFLSLLFLSFLFLFPACSLSPLAFFSHPFHPISFPSLSHCVRSACWEPHRNFSQEQTYWASLSNCPQSPLDIPSDV